MLQGFCGPDLRAEERGLQPPPTPGPKNGNRAGCLQSLIIPAQSRHSGENVGPRMAVPRCPDTGPAGSSARFLLAGDECLRLYGPSQCCLALVKPMGRRRSRAGGTPLSRLHPPRASPGRSGEATLQLGRRSGLQAYRGCLCTILQSVGAGHKIKPADRESTIRN